MRGPQYPVVIVSAYGRGHAMAQELKQADIPVALLDVSPYLGESTAEDEEGPFGFMSEKLQAFESQRLLEEHPPLLQVQGFTWMFPEGPLEMRGPLAGLHREALKVSDKIWAWVAGEGPGSVKEHQFLLNEAFSDTWLYHLSRSFHANRWSPNYRAGLVEGSIGFGSDFMVRSVYRGGLQKALDVLSEQGHHVIANAEILDVAREGSKQLRSFEVRKAKTDATELISFETVIWFLSGEETEKLAPKLQEKMFPDGILRPEGSWIRARIKLPDGPQRDSLPLHSVWVRDRDLPWSHENLFVLARTQSADLFDLWLRIPATYRLQREYVLSKVEALTEYIETRTGVKGIQIADEPSSIHKTSAEVGPARFPLFSENEWNAYRGPEWKNMFWIAPETTMGLGWNFLFEKNRRVVIQVKEWWKKREEERIKREQKALEQAERKSPDNRA